MFSAGDVRGLLLNQHPFFGGIERELKLERNTLRTTSLTLWYFDTYLYCVMSRHEAKL